MGIAERKRRPSHPVTNIRNLIADIVLPDAAGVMFTVTVPPETEAATSLTPGIRCRAFSIFVAQEAQSIPSTGRRSFAD